MAVEYAPSERAEMREQRDRGQPAEGRHRAIRQHAFVQHRGDDKHGCGRWEDDYDNEVYEGHPRAARCGYYREHHPTMLAATDGA